MCWRALEMKRTREDYRMQRSERMEVKEGGRTFIDTPLGV
jgi:hypothetical protein